MDLCIADNLRLMRQKYGYTLEALAEIIGVSRQTVAKWESEDSYPDIVNCIKLATLYKISIDELVNKPLRDIASDDFALADEKICGVIDLTDDGSVQIPEAVMQMFDLRPGGKVLLLADKRQGMAIIKCSQF